MKLKKALISIYIFVLILFFISLIVLSILGKKDRIGYLGNLTFVSSESSRNNYIYSFKINYYDKVFRNSDIYGVYLDTNSLPDYIKEIKMNDEFGTPFGTLVSTKKLEEYKIDNIKYTLKIKISIFLIFILLIFLFVIFVYIADDLCVLLIYFFNKTNVCFILKKYIIPIILFIFIFIILFNISVNNIFIVFILLILLLSIKKLRSLSNIKSHYIIVLFFSFLIFPNIIYSIFGNYIDHNNYVKRLRLKKVSFNITKINEYPYQYDKYFNDNIAFKDIFIQLKSFMDIFIFNHLVNKQVLLGKDKWLFLKDDNLMEKYIGLDYEYFTDMELLNSKKILLNFRDELKKKNIDFVLLICPDKQFVYSEYMPSYVRRKSDKSPTDKFVEYISNNTDIKLIYLKNELCNNKKNNTNLYYKYDTHWNEFGAYIAYKKLMKELNLSYTNIEFNLFNSTIKNKLYYYNALAYSLKFENTHYFNDDKIYLPTNYLKEDNMYYFDLWRKDYHITNDNFLVNKSIYFIRDSFSQGLIYYIRKTFKNSSFISLYKFQNFDITNIKPDIVIFETVERFLKERILTYLPNYNIENINIDLYTNSIITNNN